MNYSWFNFSMYSLLKRSVFSSAFYTNSPPASHRSLQGFDFVNNSQSLANAPGLSLFNNSIFTRNEAPFRQRRSQKRGIERNYRLSETLRLLLPDDSVLQILLNSDGWWRMWRQMHPDMWTPKQVTLSEYIMGELDSKMSNPVNLGKVLICICISLNQTNPDAVTKAWNLECSPEEFMEECVDTVEHTVIADDETAGTLDGVETIFLAAKHYGDVGRLRKSWILLRRAALFAQLLGLHRVGNESQPTTDTSLQRQRSLWVALYQADRLLSLTLGLPSCIGEQIAAPAIPNSLQESPYPRGMFHVLKALGIAGQITERNQSPSNLSFVKAMRLDQELEELKDSIMPAELLLDNMRGEEAEDYQERLMGCLMYNQIRTFLHMPFMLKSATNQRFDYSRLAAVEAARDMTLCYHALRGHPGGYYVCKVIDFVAFTSAMLMLLNLLGQNNYGQDSEEDSDWKLIYQTINILLGAAREAGGMVAAQSAMALQTLVRLRDWNEDEQQCEAGKKISIPFFGTISIIQGGNSSSLPATGLSLTSTELGAELHKSQQASAAILGYRGLNNSQAPAPVLEEFLPNPLEHTFDVRLDSEAVDPQRDLVNITTAFPTITVDNSNFGQGMLSGGLELDDIWDWVGFSNNTQADRQ
ncbi:hypothetical protein ACHAPV_010395 [Trichoderma viride]